MALNSQNSALTESLLRFDLAIQRGHLLVYSVAMATGLAAYWLGAFPLNLKASVAVWLSACLVALGFEALYRSRRFDRKLLNVAWVSIDILFTTLGVYATGGMASLWFVWYLTVSGAVAFAMSKRAVLIVSVVNTVAYLGVLMAMGQAHLFDHVFVLALCRMLFLFGSSYFFLIGVGNLQQKRLRIRDLETGESRKVEELLRMTEELRKKSEELEAANRRSQEADRLKSQFLANMSHELRTPMNSIIGFSEILVERLDHRIEAKHLSFLRHILTSGQHLLGIINDILDLSKIEAGKMEIFPEFVSVEPVVGNVCHVMRGMSKVNPQFVIDIPPDLPQIETDLAKFKQVLFNLLSNASKFSPAGRPITISARFIGTNEVDGSITVSVHDEGIGIDPMHHKLIFEEFRQVDGTARREFGGTGLGLALVKKFVELQGGRIAVDSSPGNGSVFTFTLPVRSRAAIVSRPIEIDPSLENHQSERVLVVEDDTNAYDLIAAALSSAGYVSIRARHGEEAVKIARESHPIAVTLDLVLPGLDGWEVLKKLKGDPETRDIPVVIISMVDNRDLGVALGADDYFVKPVDRELLLERLRQVTSSNRARPRVLLIDDDLSVHELLDEELSTLGYSLQSAYSGEEGLRAAESAPDVIILDLMMPGMSGFEVAGMLKQNPATANIPILILTSKEISGEDRQELASKVSSFVQKGNSARDQLVREIRRLDHRRAG